MATRKKAKPASEYTLITAALSDFQATVGASINYEINDSRLAIEDSPIFQFQSDLELMGTIAYPEERQGAELQIGIYGRELHQGQFSAKLDDYHVRDDHGARKYRKRGDRQIPIYDPPDSIGHIERRRGTQIWAGWVWIAPTTISDMLALLSTGQQLYITIDEIKAGRRRYIRGVTLQSTDPEAE